MDVAAITSAAQAARPEPARELAEQAGINRLRVHRLRRVHQLRRAWPGRAAPLGPPAAPA
jgi:hypothetical protein